MITAPNRVRIWASQLAANDLPPTCAMSGRPAETWRKFTFRTPPASTYALLVLIVFGVLGLILGAIIASAVSLRASGHLPLTRSSSRTASLVQWIPNVLIVGGFALITLIVAAAIANVDAGDSNASALGGIGVLLAFITLVVGFVGRLVFMPLVLPRARVEAVPGYVDRVVELRNVHPNFATAVLQRQQAPVSQAQIAQSK